MQDADKPASEGAEARADVTVVTLEEEDRKYAVFNYQRPTRCESEGKKRNR
jgi:hypothetical protein